MNNDEKASFQILKVIFIGIIVLIICSSLAVRANDSQINNIEITFSNGYKMNVMTIKTNVQEILDENNIVISDDETVLPSKEEKIDSSKTIKIIKKEQEELFKEQEQTELDAEKLLINYTPIIEKIIVEQIIIPFETVTKDTSGGSDDTTNKILQEGKDGLKQITYKVKYSNNIEIERTVIDETIIEEPVEEIIQINKKIIISRNETAKTASANQSSSNQNLASKVEGIEPIVKTLNTSAYTASTCGKSPSSPGYGVTSSGAYAKANYTVAAGKGYPIGTIIYIPYFKNNSNGGWFVVQDRGGAISNNRLDIYMNTYNECIKFGRRNLQCYIYIP